MSDSAVHGVTEGETMGQEQERMLIDRIERTNRALRALEALRHGCLDHFVAAERGDISEARFLSNIAWGLRDVGKIFCAEVARVQEACDHAAFTPNWNSNDVQKCDRCMYHK